VGGGKLFLNPVAYLVALSLTLVHILSKRLGILSVTSLACTVDMSQRTHDVMVGILHSAFGDVRHVAVGTRNAALSMDAHLIKFVARVLRLQDGSARELMNIIVKAHLIIVGLNSLHGYTAVLRKIEIVFLFLVL
jgi:hypothetical protein